jgi:hypothetical protein
MRSQIMPKNGHASQQLMIRAERDISERFKAEAKAAGMSHGAYLKKLMTAAEERKRASLEPLPADYFVQHAARQSFQASCLVVSALSDLIDADALEKLKLEVGMMSRVLFGPPPEPPRWVGQEAPALDARQEAILRAYWQT